MTTPHPLCFVLMPFGRKPGLGCGIVDFDAVYAELIAPAIEKAGLEPLRADEEMAGGIIHKPMFERLILCDYAVADLTGANANVFYELGLRHGIKPASTVLIFADSGGVLPFDVAPLRAIPYKLGPDGKPTAATEGRQALAEKLLAARSGLVDSPVFQLIDGFPDIQRLKTDVFRDRVEYARQLKERLANARESGWEALKVIETELVEAPGGLADAEGGVVIDLYLSYRAIKAWDAMIALADKMSKPLAATPLVREQLGLALNRAGRGDEAESVLLELITRRGTSSETCGMLGRVYKDRWDAAVKCGDTFAARGLLNKAIDAYLRGFEADWRDAYPGINAVTLMELKDPPDARRERLIPVVAYAVERRIASGKPDYWDYATLVELAVLAKDEQKAESALADALAAMREPWEPETTARNLRLIREARERRDESIQWAKVIEAELERRSE
ncbi:MAG: TRAFs-binding domain-containing protein [Nitrospira sp.]|nr:TRAFs-binding domain-containing protein [Nitrospira sp.]